MRGKGWWLATGVLAFAAPVRAADPGGIHVSASAPADVRAWDDRIEALAREGSLRLERTEDDTLLPGRRHQRLVQLYKGVPVEGAELVRQKSETGEALSVFGRFYEAIALDVAPTQSVAQARGVVTARIGSEAAVFAGPSLAILPEDGGSFRLVYTVVAGTGHDVRRYVVDARTAALVSEGSLLRTQVAAVGKGTGVLNEPEKVSASSLNGQFVSIDLLRPARITTYDMRGNIFRAAQIMFTGAPPTPADLGTDADNVWTDGPTVDAHSFVGFVYDFYFKRFGRHGWNNADLAIPQFVNPAKLTDIFLYYDQAPEFFANAFYCCGPESGQSFMAYGVGAPAFTLTVQPIQSFAGGLDIVAHEWSHGVTAFTSNLGQGCESGGLNESFSDQMGVSVDFFQRPTTANYRLGDDVFPGGFRDMGNPALFGDPDNASVASGCEPHNLAGVPNQAFYLAIEGGRNRTSGLPVEGVGPANRDQIEKTFYRGFTTKLVPSSGYLDAANATIAAATELYGSSSAAVRAVTQAWRAVGVLH
jgi:bacillolysin